MAGTVSAWSKPGAWALDSEENEEELQRSRAAPDPPAALQADFPSLSLAATTKTKKKKPQTLSLAEFTYSKPAEHHRAVEVDLLSLPTGPRQRTAEELDRSRLGGGFRSYGMGNHRDEEGSGRRDRGGGGFGRDPSRESAPSRADEIDNWASGKKAPLSRDRGERGGFFDNHSRADESDSWVSMKKSFPAPTEGGRRFGGGFGTGGGADADSWGRKKEDTQTEGRRYSGGGFDRDRFGSGGADSEKWGRNKEPRTVEIVETENAGGRPKLNLKPRTLPVASTAQVEKAGKASNPFGEARPREEVLAEKGQDWKKIDEQLEINKIKEIDESLGRKNAFGPGNGKVEDKSERSWRKHVALSENNEYIDDAPPASSEKAERELSTEEN